MNGIISKVLFSVVYLGAWILVSLIVPKYWASGVLAFGFISWALSPFLINYFTIEERFVEASCIGLGFAGCILVFWSFWYLVAFEAALYVAFKSGMFNSIHRALTRSSSNAASF